MSAVQFNDQCHQLELTRLNTHAKRWCQVCDNTRINNWRIFFRMNPLKCYLNWKICANRLSDIGQCKRRSNAKSVLRVNIKWKSASPGQGRKNNVMRIVAIRYTSQLPLWWVRRWRRYAESTRYGHIKCVYDFTQFITYLVPLPLLTVDLRTLPLSPLKLKTYLCVINVPCVVIVTFKCGRSLCTFPFLLSGSSWMRFYYPFPD